MILQEETMTMGEALKEGSRFLHDSLDREDALSFAEALLQKTLSLGRHEIYLDFDRLLTQEEQGAYLEDLNQKSKGIPLAYLTGETDFYEGTFRVDSRVLIPRHETELLVERAVGEIRRQKPEDLSIADIGTGSGNIAVSMAMGIPAAKVAAFDISRGALEVTRGNAGLNKVAHRIQFVESDLFSAWRGGPFDLILSNPPYLSEGEMRTLPPEMHREPAISLYGGPTGIEFTRRLVETSPLYLKKGGMLFVEINPYLKEETLALFDSRHWAEVRLFKDYLGLARVICARKYK